MARACSAVLHAEADRDRQIGVALDARDRLFHLRRIGRRRAGDAGDRHVIDEARGVLQDRRQPLVVRGRCRETDEVEAGVKRRHAHLVVFLGRQVDDDETVHARGFRIGEEFLDAIDVNRIVVAHQHDRRRVVAGAEVAHELQRLAHRLPGIERAQARRLHGRAVGHRVGEGHAELDHVGARRRQRLGDRERRLGVGVARGDERHQRGAAFRLQRGEALLDTRAHADFLLRSSSLRFSARIAAMRTFAVPSIRQMLMPMK